MNSDKTTLLYEGRFLRLFRHGRWEFADRVGATGAVAIVAITDSNRLVLTEQYRIPMGRRVLELPAGLAGDIPGQSAEPIAEAARRELLEETGYAAAEMVWLASGPPSAGLATEVVTFFQASGLRRVGAGGGDGHEEIQVHEIPLDSLHGWLRERTSEGRLVDPKIYAGLYLAGRPI